MVCLGIALICVYLAWGTFSFFDVYISVFHTFEILAIICSDIPFCLFCLSLLQKYHQTQVSALDDSHMLQGSAICSSFCSRDRITSSSLILSSVLILSSESSSLIVCFQPLEFLFSSFVAFHTLLSETLFPYFFFSWVAKVFLVRLVY